MKDYTIEEITAKVQEIFPGAYPGDDVDITVTKREGEVRINVSRMYDRLELSFAKLAALSDFFETRNINDDDRYSNSGCETCDYGSSYGFELVVRPDKEEGK